MSRGDVGVVPDVEALESCDGRGPGGMSTDSCDGKDPGMSTDGEETLPNIPPPPPPCESLKFEKRT